jgi:hypothetical protein
MEERGGGAAAMWSPAMDSSHLFPAIRLEVCPHPASLRRPALGLDCSIRTLVFWPKIFGRDRRLSSLQG